MLHTRRETRATIQACFFHEHCVTAHSRCTDPHQEAQLSVISVLLLGEGVCMMSELSRNVQVRNLLV